MYLHGWPHKVAGYCKGETKPIELNAWMMWRFDSSSTTTDEAARREGKLRDELRDDELRDELRDEMSSGVE